MTTALATSPLLRPEATKPRPRRRVAVVLPLGHTRDAVRRALDRSYEVVSLVAEGLGGAIAGVDAVLLDWSLLGAEPLTPFRILAAGSEGVPIIALLDRTPLSELRSVFAAGVADAVRTPIHPDELEARIELACHRRAAATPQPRPTLPGFEHLAQALATDLSAFFGASLATTAAADAGNAGEGDVIVRLPLHLITLSLEVSLYIAWRRADLALLALRMLGVEDADDAVTNDLACEAANLSAGALKRLCSPDGAPLTMGLPRRIERLDGEADHWRVRLLLDDGISFNISVDVARRAPQLVTPGALTEGMVIVDDIKTSGGTLLLAAGARLNMTLAAKIRSLLPVDARVPVLDPERSA